jgi:hypothetical protein
MSKTVGLTLATAVLHVRGERAAPTVDWSFDRAPRTRYAYPLPSAKAPKRRRDSQILFADGCRCAISSWPMRGKQSAPLLPHPL